MKLYKSKKKGLPLVLIAGEEVVFSLPDGYKELVSANERCVHGANKPVPAKTKSKKKPVQKPEQKAEVIVIGMSEVRQAVTRAALYSCWSDGNAGRICCAFDGESFACWQDRVHMD